MTDIVLDPSITLSGIIWFSLYTGGRDSLRYPRRVGKFKLPHRSRVSQSIYRNSGSGWIGYDTLDYQNQVKNIRYQGYQTIGWQ